MGFVVVGVGSLFCCVLSHCAVIACFLQRITGFYAVCRGNVPQVHPMPSEMVFFLFSSVYVCVSGFAVWDLHGIWRPL